MKNYKVVLIEDDLMVMQINMNYLKANKNIEISGIFRNGKEALDYLKHNDADLALVDYYMPVMDGKDFISELRKNNINLDIIMITSANSVNEINELLNLRIFDYILKPFTFDRFNHAISNWLSRKNILSSKDILNQSEIDNVIKNNNTNINISLEKGLNFNTLSIIKEHLIKANDYLSSNEIALEIGLSRITVRRYMNYLLENKIIKSKIDYLTGGRPSIKYKII